MRVAADVKTPRLPYNNDSSRGGAPNRPTNEQNTRRKATHERRRERERERERERQRERERERERERGEREREELTENFDEIKNRHWKKEEERKKEKTVFLF